MVMPFINNDIDGFANALGYTQPDTDDCSFEATYRGEGSYTNYVFVHPFKGISASKMNDALIRACGIDYRMGNELKINICDHHQDHEYMYKQLWTSEVL